MLTALQNWRPGIAAHSWFVAALTLSALTSLALPALQLAEIMTTASGYVSAVVLGELSVAAELQVKLEMHRRLVESAPAEVERVELERSNQLAAKLETELADMITFGHLAINEAISDQLPELKKLRETVFMFALNFAQEKAASTVIPYAQVANSISGRISAHRIKQGNIIASWSAELQTLARSFRAWVWGSVTACIIILIPVGMTISHRMVSRLVQLRKVIVRLANHDASVEVPSVKDQDEVGDIARAVIVFRSNALALLESERKLKAVNHQFDIALSNMSHGLCMFDQAQRIVVCNNRYLELYGIQPADIIPGETTLRDIVKRRIARGIFAGDTPAAYLEERLHGFTEPSITVQHLSDGRSMSISRRPMHGGGWVTVHEDVTTQQQTAKHIAHMASHDALTNLGNRTLLKERLSHELDRVDRGGGFALHYLDLDRFKAVNDAMGHPVGDALLCAVADRLLENVRKVDTVARLGGDEFAVLQFGATNADAATTLAKRLIAALSAPYIINGHHIEIGTSIGIAFAPHDSRDHNELIKFADMALYQAKELNRGSVCIYEDAIHARFIERREMERDLRLAIATDQFEIHYQPVVDLQSGRIGSAEALVRWRHPTRGLVPPLDFIPLAEETGLIVALGKWVLDAACAEALNWPATVAVAVNLSPAQFKGGDVALTVIAALSASGLNPKRLTLEITESTLLQEDHAVLATLNRLRDLGISVVLDDFGTGYSSLSYLRRFPFNGLKIDKSFIRDASGRSDCVAIVRAIVGLATSLHMKTVAEGVETAADLDMVRQAGCTHVQGYLLCRPVRAKQLAIEIAHNDDKLRAVA